MTAADVARRPRHAATSCARSLLRASLRSSWSIRTGYCRGSKWLARGQDPYLGSVDRRGHSLDVFARRDGVLAAAEKCDGVRGAGTSIGACWPNALASREYHSQSCAANSRSMARRAGTSSASWSVGVRVWGRTGYCGRGMAAARTVSHGPVTGRSWALICPAGSRSCLGIPMGPYIATEAATRYPGDGEQAGGSTGLQSSELERGVHAEGPTDEQRLLHAGRRHDCPQVGGEVLDVDGPGPGGPLRPAQAPVMPGDHPKSAVRRRDGRPCGRRGAQAVADDNRETGPTVGPRPQQRAVGRTDGRVAPHRMLIVLASWPAETAMPVPRSSRRPDGRGNALGLRLGAFAAMAVRFLANCRCTASICSAKSKTWSMTWSGLLAAQVGGGHAERAPGRSWSKPQSHRGLPAGSS